MTLSMLDVCTHGAVHHGSSQELFIRYRGCALFQFVTTRHSLHVYSCSLVPARPESIGAFDGLETLRHGLCVLPVRQVHWAEDLDARWVQIQDALQDHAGRPAQFQQLLLHAWMEMGVDPHPLARILIRGEKARLTYILSPHIPSPRRPDRDLPQGGAIANLAAQVVGCQKPHRTQKPFSQIPLHPIPPMPTSQHALLALRYAHGTLDAHVQRLHDAWIWCT